MKQISKNLCVALLVMGVVLCLNACSNANAQPGGVNAQSERWEYKTLSLSLAVRGDNDQIVVSRCENQHYPSYSSQPPLDSILSVSGKERWELVSVIDKSYSGTHWFTFKRRLP